MDLPGDARLPLITQKDCTLKGAMEPNSVVRWLLKCESRRPSPGRDYPKATFHARRRWLREQITRTLIDEPPDVHLMVVDHETRMFLDDMGVNCRREVIVARVHETHF